MKKNDKYSIIALVSFILAVFLCIIMNYSSPKFPYSLLLILPIIIFALSFFVFGFLFIKVNSKEITDEDIYHDYLFIVGVIMIIAGIVLLLLFQNKNQSLTMMISGALISLITKIKSKRNKTK
jgi:hypothetical protein